ncbi:hypothetical protein ACPUYX_20470 [Desulfosporosinus sp. SYSU MS00001]|uniref:hypothetical protein n=1 Tax=Desulfosporosinus sp. SYSU MS00001 TaxID=3416284 RepID=UPI003CF87F5F
MDILSFLPIIIMIFALASKINKGTTRPNQRPKNPYTPSAPWAQDLESAIQKWISPRIPNAIPKLSEVQDYQAEEFPRMDNFVESEGTQGNEGTPGIEGTALDEGILSSEKTKQKIFQSEADPTATEGKEGPDCSGSPIFRQNHLADAVIWAEILGKPKARISGPFARNH